MFDGEFQAVRGVTYSREFKYPNFDTHTMENTVGH